MPGTPPCVLLTGAGSFTGVWLARALVRAGVRVTATFSRPGPESYDDPLARARLAALPEEIEAAWNTPMGGAAWLALVRTRPFAAWCAHGARVGNHRDPAFPWLEAAADNTRELAPTLRALAEGGCRLCVLTRTYFEGEPVAPDGFRPPNSPYGLAKTLTREIFRSLVPASGLVLLEWVVPNPFGPLEKPGLNSYLARAWRQGETPVLRTPDYVRDFLPADLHGLAYAGWLARALAGENVPRVRRPGLWPERVGDFARRLARELAPRWRQPCPVEQSGQTDWAESPTLVNGEILDAPALGWDEASFWDRYAESLEAGSGSPRPPQ